MQKNRKQISSFLIFWPVSRVVKMPPFHGGDQGFDTPTGYLCGIICLMFSGGVTVAQRFLVPLVEVRIFTGESRLGNSMVECLTCNEVVGGSIPLLSFVI